MSFEFVDVLTLPGNPAKPNDDSFAHIENAAVVFDGATGLGESLMPGESDAAWLAHFGARRLMAHVKNGGRKMRCARLLRMPRIPSRDCVGARRLRRMKSPSPR